MQARFIVTSKACFKNLFEKVSEILIRDTVGKVYDSLWNLLFDFEGALTSDKFKRFD